MKKIIKKINKYCPAAPMVFFAAALAAGITHIALNISPVFSDNFNRTVSAAVRAALSYISGVLPFSLAETIIIMLPFLAAGMIVYVIFGTKDITTVKSWRLFFTLLSVCSLFYTTFVFSFAAGYTGTPLDEKLGLDRRAVSGEELYNTAMSIAAEADRCLDDIVFTPSGMSVMPYSVNELTAKLRDEYAAAAEKYTFIPRLRSRVKQIALSVPMTYTHISGVYTYYTGEANININFPFYTLPFTAAHEMSHQRGIAREDEANFMAYLVCVGSSDPYIRYSGCINLLEYVLDALSTADGELYELAVTSLDRRILGEMYSYSEFFSEYRESFAASVTDVVNDTYLKSQGQSAGSDSYGLVVDLAVAYCLVGR